MGALRKKSFLRTALIGALIGIVLTCYSKSVFAEKRIVSFAYSPYTVNLPVIIAQEKGFFDLKDITVELKSMKSTDSMRDAVASGHYDYGAALGTEMYFEINRMDRGSLYSFFFNVISQDHAVDSILVTADSKLKNIKELDGKKVGCFPSTSIESYLSEIKKKLKIDFEIIVVPPSDSMMSLEAGHFDALFSLEPMTCIALSTNNFRVLEFAPTSKYVAKYLPVGAYVVNGDVYKNRPNEVLAIQNALSKAAKYIENNREEAISIAEQAMNYKSGMLKNTTLPLWKTSVDVLNTGELSELAIFFQSKGVTQSANPYTEFLVR